MIENLASTMLQKSEQKELKMKDIGRALNDVKLDTKTVMIELCKDIFYSFKTSIDGTKLPDYSVRLKCIRFYMKLKKYGKGRVTMEELLGLDVSKDSHNKLIDTMNNTYILIPTEGEAKKIYLRDEYVFKELGDIMKTACKVVKVGEDYDIVSDNASRASAKTIWALLNDYIEDDAYNSLQFLRVDDGKVSAMLALQA